MSDYTDISKKYSHVHNLSGKSFEKECLAVENALSFSFNSYFEIVMTKKLFDEKSQMLAALFYRNCVYLSATYTLIRNGMLDPAGNNMRTVFETVLWQYAYLSDNKIYEDLKELALLEEQKLELIKKKAWSNTKERELENLRRKYSLQKMMKRIYSKKSFERFFFNQYWLLSHKSHSSTFGVNYNTPTMENVTTMEKRPEELKGNINATLYLCSENLVCFLNCFSDFMSQEKIDNIMKNVNAINIGLPPTLGLVPDMVDMKFKFNFRSL